MEPTQEQAPILECGGDTRSPILSGPAILIRIQPSLLIGQPAQLRMDINQLNPLDALALLHNACARILGDLQQSVSSVAPATSQQAAQMAMQGLPADLRAGS